MVLALYSEILFNLSENNTYSRTVSPVWQIFFSGPFTSLTLPTKIIQKLFIYSPILYKSEEFQIQILHILNRQMLTMRLFLLKNGLKTSRYAIASDKLLQFLFLIERGIKESESINLTLAYSIFLNRPYSSYFCLIFFISAYYTFNSFLFMLLTSVLIRLERELLLRFMPCITANCFFLESMSKWESGDGLF